jgi:hypothetical protein
LHLLVHFLSVSACIAGVRISQSGARGNDCAFALLDASSG